MTALAVLLGQGIGYSASPAMHNAAFAALGLRDFHDQRLPVPPEVFAETRSRLVGSSRRGKAAPHRFPYLTRLASCSSSVRAKA